MAAKRSQGWVVELKEVVSYDRPDQFECGICPCMVVDGGDSV